MAYQGHSAQVIITGDPITFQSETFQTEDNKIYKIDDSTKEVWAPFSTITVYDGGTPITNGFTINRLKGEIEFDSPEERTITADGEYLPLNFLGEAFEYTYTLSAENADSTSFGDRFIRREQTLKDFSASITKFFAVDQFFFELLNESTLCVTEFYYDINSPYDLRAWSLISSKEPSAAVDGLIEHSLEFEGTHDRENRVVVVN